MFAYAALVALVANAMFVHAEVVPTAPGPGDVFKQGDQCTFTWTPDSTGTWKQMNVELMSGNNWQMSHITSMFFFSRFTERALMHVCSVAVATNLDGTDATKATFSYNCPEVSVHFFSCGVGLAVCSCDLQWEPPCWNCEGMVPKKLAVLLICTRRSQRCVTDAPACACCFVYLCLQGT